MASTQSLMHDCSKRNNVSFSGACGWVCLWFDRFYDSFSVCRELRIYLFDVLLGAGGDEGSRGRGVRLLLSTMRRGSVGNVGEHPAELTVRSLGKKKR